MILPGHNSKQPAAIKRLKAESLTDRDFKDFVLEATVLSKLKHPCIVEMYGVGTTCTDRLDASSFYVVSEYCDGGTIKDLLYKQVCDFVVDFGDLGFGAWLSIINSVGSVPKHIQERVQQQLTA